MENNQCIGPFTQRDSAAICDCDAIVCDSIAIHEIKLHLKFLANCVCFDNLRASLVVLGGFLDCVNKTKSASTIFEHLRLGSEDFWLMSTKPKKKKELLSNLVLSIF